MSRVFWIAAVAGLVWYLGVNGYFGKSFQRDGFFCLHPVLLKLWRGDK